MKKICGKCGKEATPDNMRNLRAWPGEVWMIGEHDAWDDERDERCNSTLSIILKPINKVVTE